MKHGASICGLALALSIGTALLSACWDSASLNVADLTPTETSEAGSPDAHVEAGATCSAPRAVCGAVCTDTAVDPLNCGACGNDCTAKVSPVTPACTGSVVVVHPGPGVCAAGQCEFPTITFDCAQQQRVCLAGNCGGCVTGYQDKGPDTACRPDCTTAALNCSGHGACSDASGTSVCACLPGFSGPTCAVVSGPLVFVSSTTTKGNFGSLAAADTICQGLAGAKGLAGTFKAFLSDGTTNAAMRLARPAGSYRLVDGTVVATTADDLFGGTLLAPLERDEGGVLVNGEVWTGSGANGTASGSDCNNWTDGTSAANGTEGVNNFADGRWANSYDQFCDRDGRLYCVQQ